MDRLMEVFSIIAVFSGIHERVLEAIRALEARLPDRKVLLDRLTVGGWNWAPAVILALVTRANLLALLSDGTQGFFACYLHSWFKDVPADPLKEVTGCLLMGLTTTLGSRFWHDLVKVLVDLRTGLKSLPEAARRLAAPDVSRAFSVAAEMLARHETPATMAVSDALRAAADATVPLRPAHEVVTTQLISKSHG
ncbi:hypothetical protein [Corallococcus sp. 4LFB]|uniref:hypothetical protein n=1 Tax=Corallococcus sp. 4LFB TaxID=3383249 RepID=UPI0039754214